MQRQWIRGFKNSHLPSILKNDFIYSFIFDCAWSHAKSWLIGKDSDAGRDWGQEEKGVTEDEMAGWHHRFDGHEFEWNLGVGDGQGGLVCCDSWGHRVGHDWATELNWCQDYKKECLNTSICWWCWCWQACKSSIPSPELPHSSAHCILWSLMDHFSVGHYYPFLTMNSKCVQRGTELYFKDSVQESGWVLH